MPRHNRKAGGRRFDTRLNFKQLCKIAGINVRQRILILRYLKEVDILDDKTSP